MEIYLITGYTKNIGLWEVEIFRDREDAVNAFNYYIEEYNAVISKDDEWLAEEPDGGYFYLERRVI